MNQCDFIQFYIILYIRDFIFLITLAKMCPLQYKVCRGRGRGARYASGVCSLALLETS